MSSSLPASLFLAEDDLARRCLRALNARLGRSGPGHDAEAQPGPMLDLPGSGVVVVDARMRVLFLNPRAIEISGVLPDGILGKPCSEGMRCVACRADCALFRLGSFDGRQGVLRSADGRDLILSKSASVLRDEHGNVVGGLEVFHDLTDICHEREEAIRGEAERSARVRMVGRAVLDGDPIASAASASAPGVMAQPRMVGTSSAIQDLMRRIPELAARSMSVVITGETGTGKEVVANALHAAGPRRQRPFVAVHCAALPEALLESELFGHERGAFTGAVRAKPGKFEQVADGTLLLDEVACIPLPAQAKLLRVLETREFERVGGTSTRRLAARIVAATNADLWSLVRAGTFREDLFYRLHVVPLHIPPLRERIEDVAPLARHFLALAGASAVSISAESLRAMERYPWPGNARELRNVIQRALAVGAGGEIGLQDLPPDLQPSSPSRRAADERSEIEHVLRAARFQRTLAARMLGVSRTTLWRRMRKLELA